LAPPALERKHILAKGSECRNLLIFSHQLAQTSKEKKILRNGGQMQEGAQTVEGN
jgi:hypothetical protein